MVKCECWKYFFLMVQKVLWGIKLSQSHHYAHQSSLLSSRTNVLGNRVLQFNTWVPNIADSIYFETEKC